MASDVTGFSEIGLGYAKHYREVEAARALFLRERDEQLTKLAAILRGNSAVATVRDADGYRSHYVANGEWTRVRGAQPPKKSGFTFAIEGVPHFGMDGRMVFTTFAFFQMGAPRLKRFHARCPAATCNLEHREGFAREMVSSIMADAPDFEFTRFALEVERLPAAFAEIDRRLAVAWREFDDD